LHDALGNDASTYLAESGDLDAALQLFHPHAGKADAAIAMQLAQFVAEEDPSKAGAWLAGLPAETDTGKAAQTVVDTWYPKEPEAAARWVEALPAGPRRDQALSAFVEKANEQDPAGAAEWAETIADPKLRQQAAVSVFMSWTQDDPAAARQWMIDLGGVDEEWHARFLRRHP
jgi:hypothetical protein